MRREDDPVDTPETLYTPWDPDADFGVQRSRIRLVQSGNLFALSIRELTTLNPRYKLELVLKVIFEQQFSMFLMSVMMQMLSMYRLNTF